DFLNADGTRRHTGQAGTAAQRWADLFTEKFEELSKQDSTFGMLRNLIDVSVAAALIDRENLFDRVRLHPKHLLQEEPLEAFNVPKQVSSRASFVKKGSNYLISAS